MRDLHKMSDLPLKSEYERPRNIPNYLDRIKQKSKGTVRNINGFLSRFDAYLVLTYKKPNEIVLKEILAFDEEPQRRAILDILRDYDETLATFCKDNECELITADNRAYIHFFSEKKIECPNFRICL